MPNLDNLTAFEAIWIVITFITLLIVGELYLRAREDLVAVLATETNGARLMTARTIRRRYLLVLIEVLCLVAVSVVAGLVDRLPPDLRWFTPLMLSILAMGIVLNTVLDTRDRARIIDYIQRLEVAAKAGKKP